MDPLPLSAFPLTAFDKIRYADTDRQGHVNNAVFPTFLETGRVEFLYDAGFPILEEGDSFVIVSLDLKFRREIHWPGQVDVGTAIQKIGNSSITLYQQIFQGESCVATSTSVIVQVDKSGKSKALEDVAKAKLQSWVLAIE